MPAMILNPDKHWRLPGSSPSQSAHSPPPSLFINETRVNTRIQLKGEQFLSSSWSLTNGSIKHAMDSAPSVKRSNEIHTAGCNLESFITMRHTNLEKEWESWVTRSHQPGYSYCTGKLPRRREDQPKQGGLQKPATTAAQSGKDSQTSRYIS